MTPAHYSRCRTTSHTRPPSVDPRRWPRWLDSPWWAPFRSSSRAQRRRLPRCMPRCARTQTRPPTRSSSSTTAPRMPRPPSPAAAGARWSTSRVRGIWPATAAGFDAASGDLLARLDADSVPPPDWLAEIERRMTAADRPTVVTGPGSSTAATRCCAGSHTTSTSAATSPSSAPCSGIRRSSARIYAIRADAWRSAPRHRAPRPRRSARRPRPRVVDAARHDRGARTAARCRCLRAAVRQRGGLARRVRMAFHMLAVESRAGRRSSAAPSDGAAGRVGRSSRTERERRRARRRAPLPA